MGAALTWLWRAVQWGGTAALGYFSNDLADWAGRVTGTKETYVDGSGVTRERTPWWVVLLLLLLAGAVLAWVISLLKPKNVKS